MTDDYVLPPPDDVAGTKKLQTKLNTVGVNNVHAECIYLVAANGTDNPIHQVQSNSANIATEATVGSVKTAVETIDNCISGNEAQADVLTVRDVQPGYAAANLGKRAASETYAQYDIGVMALARRDDNNAEVCGDHTFGPLNIDAEGRLKLAAGALAIGKLAANSGVDIGDADVTSVVDSCASMDHGSNLAVGVAAEVLTATSFSAKRGVQLKADKDNAGVIYVGNSDVTDGDTEATDGVPLAAGDVYTMPIANPNKIYVIASQAAQKIYWSAF